MIIKTTKVFVLSLIISSNIILSNSVYSNFKSYMKKNVGSVFKVEYGHRQFGESIIEEGEIFFESYNNFIFDNSKQRIIYTKNIIKTINKKNKQIIYDKPLSEQLTIFDFIFTDNYVNQFNEIHSDSIYSTFNFDLDSYGYIWSLKVYNTSGKPKRLSLISDKSDSIIYINFESILKNESFNTDFVDTLGYELIDFRE